MVRNRRNQGINIVIYLDDGLGVCKTQSEAITVSETVKNYVIQSGFVPNVETSVWEPVQCLVCLGHNLYLRGR